VAVDRRFFKSLQSLSPKDRNRIWDTVVRFRTDHRPGDNLEQLQGRGKRSRWWTLRASQDLRVLLGREGPTCVLVYAGHHDDVYRYADRNRFVCGADNGIRIVEVRREREPIPDDEQSNDQRTPLPAAADEPSVLEHWTHAELVQAGFSPELIKQLRIATAETLADVCPDLDNDTADKIVECMDTGPEDYFQQRVIEDENRDNKRFRDAIIKNGALAGISQLLSPDELERLLSAPIEDWMLFLHPDQRTVVDRRFNGPARVRGSAGTGKTVVALHRAASLAHRFSRDPDEATGPAPVLFTTYIKTLPPLFEHLYSRLPNALPDAVEFIHIDSLARRVCQQAGQGVWLNPKVVNEAFDHTWTSVISAGTPLQRAGITRIYLRDEITEIIKGRGVDSKDEYMALKRTGRRMQFPAPMREQVWTFREEWDKRLADQGAADFADVILRARNIARDSPPAYRAAIVDEAQDFTLARLQLVMALAGIEAGVRTPDSLFIVGDGAQKIYPGGFTLRQAGMDIRGNSAVLKVNYRNARPVIEAAMACTGSEVVDDHGDVFARGDAELEATRDGVKPRLVAAGKLEDQANFVVERISALAGDELGFGDFGVFAPKNDQVQKVSRALAQAGVPRTGLDRWSGESSASVKVGTFHRAKGLEFKVVFVLDVSQNRFPSPRWRQQSDEEHQERRTLEISSLFVAMTRARDGLFLLCNDVPSAEVVDALDYFDEEDARPRP